MIRGITTAALALALIVWVVPASASEPSARADCPLAQASLEGTVMVIDDVTTVPGCDAQDDNIFGLLPGVGGEPPAFHENSQPTASNVTVAGPGCLHHASLTGIDEGVSCAGATSMVVYSRGGNDEVDTDDHGDTVLPVIIHLGDGNDLSGVSHGIYTVFGDAGNDRLTGTTGGDSLYGGTGIDHINGNTGDDTILGGPGNDVLTGTRGNDVIVGGPGSDRMTGQYGRDLIKARDGEKDIFIDCGFDADAPAVYDRGLDPQPRSCGRAPSAAPRKATCPLSEASLNGTVMVISDVTDVPGCEGEDVNKIGVFPVGIDGDPGYMDSTNIAPTTAAGAGCIHHVSGGGVDFGVTCPGATSIVIKAQGKDDRVTAIDSEKTGMPMTVYGGEGNDKLFASGAKDKVYGGAGKDSVGGGGLNDFLSGGSGRDFVAGGNGDDDMSGGSGNDRLQGGAGDDTLIGGPGRDILHGGKDKDLLKALDHRKDLEIDCGQGTDPEPAFDVGLDPKPRNC